jgi:alkylation response protein AidB-like acyl-CoA dehydrogenase
MTTFLVEKKQGFGEVGPGLVIPGMIEKMGYKGVDTTELIFAGYRASHEQILGGTPGRGFYQMMDGVEVGRVNVAARGCGVALRAFELAVSYAQQRTSFGKPIAQHQAVQFRLADMATKVTVARQMVLHAAALKDAGQPCLTEAAMAKLYASEMAEEVCSAAIQIHGGYGYVADYLAEKIWRDVRVCQIYEGTSDVQRILIGRGLAAL